MPRTTIPSAREDGFFLPDFCGIHEVFTVVVAGQLLALTLVLGTGGGWARLALVSLFVQWVALAGAGALCLSRRALVRLPEVAAGVAGYLLLLLVTVVVSEAAYWLVATRLVVLDPAGAWVQAQPARSGPALRHGEFLLRNLAVSAIVAAVALRYLYVHSRWKRNVERAAQARIQALQSRIRPHFLFNSMNTIASLARSQPALAEQVTEDLAELFRASLGDARVPVTLARELDLCRQYLRIEQQRLGERLKLRFDTDALPARARIPALTLQPLVENAVYHGIEPLAEGGEVTLGGSVEAGEVRIRIGNPLPDLAPGVERPGNRMAQDNVAQRLDAYFGAGARVDIDESAGHYTVTLRFPHREEDRS